MKETTEPSAPIKPRRGFFMNPWVPMVLIICLAIVWVLNATGYITLSHINLLNYFENSNAPSFTLEPTVASKTASKPTPTPAPKTSCPTNSHQNPSDVAKCLCDSGYERNSAGNGCVAAETFDVKINSLNCFFTFSPNEYGTAVRHNRVIVRGTAQGPVGARLELPILGWPTDVWDCGGWALTTGGYVTVGDTCIRREGQPETTNWSVDTGGEETGGYEIGDAESYTAELFSKDPFADNLLPRKVAQTSTVCQ